MLIRAPCERLPLPKTDGGPIEQDVVCLIYHKFYKSPVAGPPGSVAHIMAATQVDALTSAVGEWRRNMRRSPMYGQKVGDQIAELLRQTYDDVLREPLPDRFRDLLEGLEMDRPFFLAEARAREDSDADHALTER